jgi:hypothetical protein
MSVLLVLCLGAGWFLLSLLVGLVVGPCIRGPRKRRRP